MTMAAVNAFERLYWIRIHRAEQGDILTKSVYKKGKRGRNLGQLSTV